MGVSPGESGGYGQVIVANLVCLFPLLKAEGSRRIGGLVPARDTQTAGLPAAPIVSALDFPFQGF